MVFKVGGFLVAVMLFGLTWTDKTELVYTKAAFKKTIRSGFSLAYIYTLDKAEQDEIELPDGSRGYSARWHQVSRTNNMLNRLCCESDYNDVISCIRVNLTRGDLAPLKDIYQVTGDSIMLFMEGIQVGKNIPIGPDFSLAVFKQTGAWLKFDDFIQQELADRKEAEQKKTARDRERRRAYNYYYGPRPYVSAGWGGGYYGPYWGGGWGAPYVGFGFSI